VFDMVDRGRPTGPKARESRLLRFLWPDVMRPYRGAARHLSDRLDVHRRLGQLARMPNGGQVARTSGIELDQIAGRFGEHRCGLRKETGIAGHSPLRRDDQVPLVRAPGLLDRLQGRCRPIHWMTWSHVWASCGCLSSYQPNPIPTLPKPRPACALREMCYS
jgi:hypothetical protein